MTILRAKDYSQAKLRNHHFPTIKITTCTHRKWWFNERGMTARYNTASSVKLHDKVVMIDHRWIVQGSHNWTPGPMSTNVEATLLMEAKAGDQWTWDQYHEDLKLGITRQQGQ